MTQALSYIQLVEDQGEGERMIQVLSVTHWKEAKHVHR